jgi:serine/threonine protein kinase
VTEAPPQLSGMTFVKNLGEGGFAQVFLYEQERPRMRVAVKVMLGQAISDSARDRFAAEANTMATLADHPNIVQVFRSDVTDDGRPYMVMKYYPQQNLAVRSRAERIPVSEVLQIGVLIASAVETAHAAGIVHRDIKPANILTSQYGEPGLTDFGIATMIDVDVTDESDGMSIPWSPPEVVFGQSAGDRLSDVYSLGATLWHLLAGRSPFEEPHGDNSTVAIMRRVKEQPPPRTGRTDVPPSLERVLAQAMSKNPVDRPQSALQLARSLQAVETQERFAPTRLVIGVGEPESDDDAGVPDPAKIGLTSDRTRAPDRQVERPTRQRRAQEVVAQASTASQPATKAPAPTTPPQERAPESGPTRRRASKPAPEGSRRSRVREGLAVPVKETETRRRVPIASPTTAVPSDSPDLARQPEEEEAPHGRRAWALAGVGVVVGGTIVVIGLSLGGQPGRSTSTTTTSGPAPTVFQPMPSNPTVHSTILNATQVEFSWDDPDAQVGDTFLYSENGGTYVTTGHKQSVVLPLTATSSACLQVEIDRSGPISAPSPVVCSGG